MTGLAITSRPELDHSSCEDCILGKIQRAPFSSPMTQSDELGGRIHTDLWGPARVETPSGKKYMITFTDENSRFRTALFMRTKAEALACFEVYKAWFETQTGMKIKVLHADGGGEYISGAFKAVLDAAGIILETTTPDTPESNGIAERLNRTIYERVRCMLLDGALPATLWAEAASTVVYTLNMLPTKAVDLSPHEIMLKRKPDVSHLRAFGCVAYTRILEDKRGKLDARAMKGVLVGYYGDAAYRVWDPQMRKIVKSRDVVFEEGRGHRTIPVEGESPSNSTDIVPAPVPAIVPAAPIASIAPLAIEPRRSTRIPIVPSNASTGCAQNPTAYARGYRLGKAVADPIPDIADVDLPVEGEFAGLTGEFLPAPLTYEEASTRSDSALWLLAMEEEYGKLDGMGAWTIMVPPDGRRTIGCRWVYANKLDGEGRLIKRKARIVAKGYSQIPGVDFSDTFAPVARFDSSRILDAIAASEKKIIVLLDFELAYLNAPLGETVFMKQPPGFEITGKGLVCRLDLALYGTRQAGHEWNKLLNTFLSTIGLMRLHSDHAFYYRRDDQGETLLVIHVDDVKAICDNHAGVQRLILELKLKFKIRDTTSANRYLGIDIVQDMDAGTVKISQKLYIQTLLERFDLATAHIAKTPLPPGILYTKNDCPTSPTDIQSMSEKPYRAIVGSLMYASVATRPDISYSVQTLSQFCQNPGMSHWNGAVHVLRYLSGTSEVGIIYRHGAEPSPVGYFDADWGMDVDDRRSISGYAFLMAGGAIGWSAKKQATVAMSSTEAEYVASTYAGRQAVWVNSLLGEIGRGVPVMDMRGDNQGAIALSENPVFHARTKHIHISERWISEKVGRGEIRITYIPTTENLADIFTKSLVVVKHVGFVADLGLGR